MKSGTKLHATFAVAAWCVVYAIEHAGNSPSVSEIAAHFGIRRLNAQRTIERMYKYGIAERIDNKLVIVGGEYLPPQWFIENVHPPLSKADRTEQSRRTGVIIPVSVP